MATFTRGPSMVQTFASNACGFILRIQERLPRCVVDVVASSSPINGVRRSFAKRP
jgi:hypothetical protein